jgi:hypothetical protein
MSPEHRSYVSSIVEEVRANDSGEPLTRPEAIICIPVAAHNETPQTLGRMFDTLAKQRDADKLEIFLFGNYPDTISDDDTVAAHANITEAVKQAREKYPNLHLRYATVGFKEADMGIGGVRKNMMDIIAADAADRGLDYSQPVVWVDADLTSMSKEAVTKVADAIRGNEAFFVHMNSRQTIVGIGAAALSKSTSSHKIAAHYELSRRTMQREKLKDDSTNNGFYLEESGLSFALGNYLLIGGVNRGDAVNESAWLQAAFTRDIYPKTDEIWLNASGKEKTTDNIVKYLQGARIYTSGRRLVAMAQEYVDEQAAGNNKQLDDIGNNYFSFSHSEELRGGVDIQDHDLADEEKDRVIQGAASSNQRSLKVTQATSDRILKRVQNK